MRKKRVAPMTPPRKRKTTKPRGARPASSRRANPAGRDKLTSVDGRKPAAVGNPMTRTDAWQFVVQAWAANPAPNMKDQRNDAWMRAARAIGGDESRFTGDDWERVAEIAGREATVRPMTVQYFSLDAIQPSPENDRLYRPIDPADPELEALANSVRKDGVREALIVSSDGFIISGHRRFAAARMAGLKAVPATVDPIRRGDDLDAFVRLLATHNRQRVKNHAEVLREELVLTDPATAYRALVEHRRAKTRPSPGFAELASIERRERAARCRISSAKTPFLDAVLAILEQNREFWPLSIRQIHYRLLNRPPLRHAAKPRSVYRQDEASYKSLLDLATRGRLNGLIPWEATEDETRPCETWHTFESVRPFVRQELRTFLHGYWRNLMQTQPAHIEVLGEKLTIRSIIEEVCERYTIPYTIGRGYSSILPRRAIAQRFENSGKDRLIVLVLSDQDADGMGICESFATSMREDFGVVLEAYKVAITIEQARAMRLPTNGMQAKESSAQYERYVELYQTTDAWELEALEPSELQRQLINAIETVIDREAFTREVAAERTDAAVLEAWRKKAQAGLSDLLDGESATAP